MKNTYIFILVLLISSINAISQNVKKDTTYVNELLDKSKALFGEDPNKAIAISKQAKDLAADLNFKKGEAIALKNIGIGFYVQQKYVEMLDYWGQSLVIYEEMNDEVGISNILNNIGAVYMEKGDDAKALEYCLKALKLGEKSGDKMRIMSALTNIGSVYYNKKDPKAIDYLLRASSISEELGNKESSAVLLGNIGEVYSDKGDDAKAANFYQKAIKINNEISSAAFAYNGLGKISLKKNNFSEAMQNHLKAMAIAEKVGDKLQQLRAQKGIANVHFQQSDFKTALEYYTRAKNLGEEIKANVELKDLYQDISNAYAQAKNYENAFLYKTKYADIKDTLYSIETAQKLGILQFDFDLYKKEGEIKLLTNEKKLNEVELRTERQAKTAFAIGLGFLAIMAFIIYRGYRNKVKINKVLDKQKIEIEGLLSNILPSEIAKELQQNGKAVPRSYESVSVLFSDFRNFTQIAEKMSPEELVKELNICFMAFDSIIENNKLEKIKTIGDSYMCAGGIPTADISHPFRIVKAGLEIQEYIKEFNQRRIEKNLEPLEMRIGIHVGPVVAGVVGKKKYAYDIWGSTVNIASRMESNGEPGKVNISAATYEYVKEKYVCIHRGKLYAKNVGDIDMYFVQGEITLLDKPVEAANKTEALDDVVIL